MICPNCSHEIPDGLLLCEKCGAEVKIVPDFEIEVENSINETLSSIVDELNPEDKAKEENKVKPDKSIKTPEEKIEEDFFKERESILVKKPKKSVISYIFLSVVVVIAAGVLSFLFGYKNFSVNYQVRESDASLMNADYDTALSYIDRALELRKNDSELILKKSNILISMGYDDEAIELLKQSIDKGNIKSEELMSLYGALIAIYSGNEDYKTIADLLFDCTDENVLNEYSEFMANPPEFSLPTGNYDSEIELSISADLSGQIIYTINGTDPNQTKGIHYNRPLNLKAGEYDVRAIYVNSFGVTSQVVSSYYLIDSEIPSAPLVNPESGDYDKPFMLQVETLDDGTVYYTNNGRDPVVGDESTYVYSEPINVDFGTYNYSFITVSKEGVSSEVVKRSYSVNLNTKITEKMAEYQLINKLTELGYIDANKGAYTYNYDSIVDISGTGYYYRFDEYLEDDSGEAKPTGLLYAVNVYDNSVYRLTLDESGKWGVIPIG